MKTLSIRELYGSSEGLFQMRRLVNATDHISLELAEHTHSRGHMRLMLNSSALK